MLTNIFSKKRVGMVVACLLGLAACSAAQQETVVGDLLVSNAQIVDPQTQEIRIGSLVISDGKIIKELKEAPKSFEGEVIDASGRWVMPGLVDMHVHSFGNRAPSVKSDNPGTSAIAERVLMAGVTGFVDLFGDEQTLIEARANQQAKKTQAADIMASLSCLTASGGHCTEYGIPTRTMNTPSEATAVVNDLAQQKPDVIKIVYQPTDDQPSIDKPTFQAAVKAAKAHDLKTIVHIKTWDDVADAVDVGVSAVTHIPAGPIPDGLAERMASTGTVSIPALAEHTDLTDFVFDPDVLKAPLAKSMTNETILNAYSSEKLLNVWGDREERWKKQDNERLDSVRKLVSAGVTILAGTDAGNWGTIQGYSLHRELIKLTRAGLTPWQVLAAATTHAGDFLDKEYGVHKGAQASLVILNASPIDNIENTQKIEMVIHHGNIVAQD